MVESSDPERLRGARADERRHPTGAAGADSGTAVAVGRGRRGGGRRRHPLVDRRRRSPPRSSPSIAPAARPGAAGWCSPAAVRSPRRRRLGRPGAGPARAVPRLGAGASTSRSATPARRRVSLEIDGERHELWVRGRCPAAGAWPTGGPATRCSSTRRARGRSTTTARRRVAWQHVVGVVRRRRGSATSGPGDRVAVASNRVRGLIERGAAVAAGRPRRAGPGPRHRRRPRPAAGDGPAVPRQRPGAPVGGVRAERPLT